VYLFDNLISNPDRNSGNLLVDRALNIILIDHSRAFLSTKKLAKDRRLLPYIFDRRLVERLKALNRPDLDSQLKDLLWKGQIKCILARRDRLLAHMDKLIAERGEAAVLF
jgi:hypothetical protein